MFLSFIFDNIAVPYSTLIKFVMFYSCALLTWLLFHRYLSIPILFVIWFSLFPRTLPQPIRRYLYSSYRSILWPIKVYLYPPRILIVDIPNTVSEEHLLRSITSQFKQTITRHKIWHQFTVHKPGTRDMVIEFDMDTFCRLHICGFVKLDEGHQDVRCKAKEFVQVDICSFCQRFGHLADSCELKRNPNAKPCCGLCAKLDHTDQHCPMRSLLELENDETDQANNNNLRESLDLLLGEDDEEDFGKPRFRCINCIRSRFLQIDHRNGDESQCQARAKHAHHLIYFPKHDSMSKYC